MNKKAYFIICVAIVIGLGIVFISNSKSKDSTNKITPISIKQNNNPVENSEVRDGIQYITITAKGGYSPKISNAKAGIPTKLIIKTNGTYDCSSSIVFNSIGYKKILPQTGEEIVDIGTYKTGEEFQGLCSMGMYNFVINFI